MKIAVLGLGGRGKVYAHFAKFFGCDVVAVCEKDESKRETAYSYGVSEDGFYTDENKFFAAGKLADALVIATMDRDHYSETIKALDIGYDILLEKPIAVSLKECEDIEKKAKETGRKVVVCHVMRYAPLWVALKRTLDSGILGKPISLSQTENIAYYHYAHSFVRGNWRNEKLSSPLIIQKNCHDLDMICWLLNKKCISVSSYGALSYFKEENAPEGSAAHCVDCKYKNNCKYSAFLLYNNAEYESIAGLAAHGRLGGTEAEINASLSDRSNPYSRCVYRCDNDVCDHQIVNMLFEDNVTAQLKSVAFTEKMSREIEINCEKGTLYKKENGDLAYCLFGEKEKIVEVEKLEGGYKHHGGGDIGIMKSFVSYLESGVPPFNVTDISVSVMSHKIGFLADKSQKRGGKVYTL